MPWYLYAAHKSPSLQTENEMRQLPSQPSDVSRGSGFSSGSGADPKDQADGEPSGADGATAGTTAARGLSVRVIMRADIECREAVKAPRGQAGGSTRCGDGRWQTGKFHPSKAAVDDEFRTGPVVPSTAPPFRLISKHPCSSASRRVHEEDEFPVRLPTSATGRPPSIGTIPSLFCCRLPAASCRGHDPDDGGRLLDRDTKPGHSGDRASLSRAIPMQRQCLVGMTVKAIGALDGAR